MDVASHHGNNQLTKQIQYMYVVYIAISSELGVNGFQVIKNKHCMLMVKFIFSYYQITFSIIDHKSLRPN